MKTVKITHKFLDNNIGAWISEATAKKLGVRWPLKKGWRQNLIGKEIPESIFGINKNAERFFELYDKSS